MELSRLSNSLGSVCSQRRGPAGGCSGPSLALSLPSIPLPLEPLEHFSPVHERPPAVDPAGLLCLLVLNAAPGGPLMWTQPPRGPRSQALLSQWDVWLAGTFHPATPYKSPNLRGCCGRKPSMTGHCFPSCPVRHASQHSGLTGPGHNKRFWSLTWQTSC